MNYYVDKRTGMQVGAIKDTSAINWNIDAEITGFEGSLVAFLSETLRLDFNWLVSDSEVASGSDNIIDPLNPAAASGVFAYLGAVDAATNNAGLLTVAVMDNLTQVFKSAGFICLAAAAPLQGVPCTNDGVAQDISGNRIPAQQDLSYNIALTKTFETGNGAVDIRLSRKYRGQMFMDIWNNERSDLDPSSNGDLFKCIASGKASVVTDEIEKFTNNGILLKSGSELKADVVATATGFNMNILGDIKFKIDNKPLKSSEMQAWQSLCSYVPQSINLLNGDILSNIAYGLNEKEIYEFLKEKYGEWIVYKPRFNQQNIILCISMNISEKVGFEPTEACTSSDFKSDAIDQLCHLSTIIKSLNGQEGIRTPDTVVRSHVL